MSDSDCSNCGKINCRYRENSYNCVIRTAKDAQAIRHLIDIDSLLKVKQTIEKLESEEFDVADCLVNTKDGIDEFLELLNIDTENHEYTRFGVSAVKKYKDGTDKMFAIIEGLSYDDAQEFLENLHSYPRQQPDLNREVCYTFYNLTIDTES